LSTPGAHCALTTHPPVVPRMQKDTTAEEHLDLLLGLENYLGRPLASYEEFMLDGKCYYFSPGGFLYRKDPRMEEVGGSFCGYLDDEVWDHLKNYLNKEGVA
jgi:hypothetical protein